MVNYLTIIRGELIILISLHVKSLMFILTKKNVCSIINYQLNKSFQLLGFRD